MSEQSIVPETHPLMIAWKVYKATDDYACSREWAKHDDHVDGSLWAAFDNGYRASADAIRALENERDEWKSQCEQWAQKASEWAVEKEQWEARLAVVHNRLYLSRSSSCAAIARALAAEQSRDALAKAIQTIVTTGARDERTLLGVTQGIVLVDEKDFDALRSLIEALDNG